MITNNIDFFVLISSVEVGKHFYGNLFGINFHGQVFIVSLFVIFILVLFSYLATSNLKTIPEGFQNFMEFVVEFTENIAKEQIGESYFQKSCCKRQPTKQLENIGNSWRSGTPSKLICSS